MRAVLLEIHVFETLFVCLLQTAEERHQQWCTAITHPIMTPVRHSIRHQLCLRLLAGRAAGAWAGRDEKTKAKHGAHVTGRSCR